MPLLLSPGQGAQSAGMLRPWLALPDARRTVERWSELTGLDLVALGSDADAKAIRPTQVAQPLLTAAARPTGLAAMLGGQLDEKDLQAAGLELATINVPGHVVVGGPVEVLDAWVPPAGARVRRLDVAGAFHTSAMLPAIDGFARLIDDLQPRDARCDVIANADGVALRDGRQLLDRLVDQLIRPVRFDLCLSAFSGPAVELAPAGVLAALLKRARPDLAVTSLRTPDDLLVAA